ncbi:MAG: tetratricopeptide repeat protein [Fibrobacteres bacterium]|nr:tetratricopeptide repeat protein [Fibrobacterota bacterium]
MNKGVAAVNYKTAFLTTLAATAFSFGQITYKPHAYQQNDWFSEFGDNTAMYVNPASIAENDQIEVAVGLFQTISGKAGQEFISAVHPFDYNHSVGVSVFENGSPIDGTNAVYLENAYSVGYAYRLGFFSPNGISNKVAVGANFTMIQFNAFNAVKSFGYGGDLGLSYNPFSTSRYGHLQLGVSVQNVLQPLVKLPDNAGDYKIPRNLNLSYFWRGFNNRLELAGSGSLIDISHDAAEGPGGNEFVYTQRATYYLSPLLGLKMKLTKLGYPVFGATVNVKRVNLFRYLQLDLDMSHDRLQTLTGHEDEGRGFVWNFKAITRVGPTREERIGEARYRRLKIEPEDAYREAMRLYLARKFLLASYAFGKVITKYPSFHLVDQAAFYKGKSFENLRMHQAARDVYNDALKRYTDSDQRPKYMFQLMNIDYKEGKFDEATKRYQQIVNLYPESDVKSDADYVMGQMRFIQKDYYGAISLLSPILPGNANYVYARFTLGMAYVNLKKYKEAEAAFQDIMETKPSNSSEQEMKEVTAVKLGHINFGKEPPALVKAAEFYGSVSPSSSKYDEALLGLAWSFIKVQRPKEAAGYANDIVSKTPKSLLVPEAHLLLGYCAYFDKDYDKSIKEFDNAIDLAEKKAVAVADIQKKKEDNMMNSQEFASVQKEALLLSNQLPTPRVMEKREQLRPKFDDIHKKIEDYLEFLRETEQIEKFLANKDRIIKDAKFTKATVINIKAGAGEKAPPSKQDIENLDVK